MNGSSVGNNNRPDVISIAFALSHPTRFQILEAMTMPRRQMSPRQFCELSGSAMNHVGYHFRKLEQLRCIRLVAEVPVNGAVEHFYVVRPVLAWDREVESLNPAVRQNLAGSLLGAAVGKLGEAINNETYGARPNTHLSIDTIRVDESGWERVTAIMDRALVELMEVREECFGRLDREEGFDASFLMTAYESPKT